MRLKIGIIAIIITAAIGIPWYLDARIPRATASIQVHPSIIPVRPASFSRSHHGNIFETITSPETLRAALKQLHSESGKKKALTDRVIEDLRKKISANPRRGTDFIEITAKDPSKEQAIRIANAVAQALIVRQNEIDKTRAKRALTALDEELEAQSNLVKKHRAILTPLIGSYGIPYFDKSQPPPTPSIATPMPTEKSFEPKMPTDQYKQAKEAYEQSRDMLREMKIKQEEARVFLKTPHSSVTIYERAK